MKTVKVKVRSLNVCSFWKQNLKEMFGEKIAVNYRNIMKIDKEYMGCLWLHLREICRPLSPAYRYVNDQWAKYASLTPTRVKKFLKLFYAK